MYNGQVNRLGESEMIPTLVGAPRLTFDHDIQVLEIHDDEVGGSVKVCSEDIPEFLEAIKAIIGEKV